MKQMRVVLLVRPIKSDDESGKSIKVKVDMVTETHHQPGAEVEDYKTTKERFFDVSVFHDPLNYGFLFDGCPLIIQNVESVKFVEEKK